MVRQRCDADAPIFDYVTTLTPPSPPPFRPGAIPVIREHAFSGADPNGKSAASALLDENIVARAGAQGADVLALLLFSRAAELGSAEASHNLALMALAGRGTFTQSGGSRNSKRDFKQALALFQKAAAAGSAPSAVRAVRSSSRGGCAHAYTL